MYPDSSHNPFTGRLLSAASALEGLTGPVARSLAPAAARRRILVVEDDDDARETLRVLLTLAGHEVHTAADGPMGIEMASTMAPDVALIDVGLPGVDGYAVARQIRAGAVGKAIVLVALTGYGHGEGRRLALEAGFDAHVVKPVSFANLTELVADGRRNATSP